MISNIPSALAQQTGTPMISSNGIKTSSFYLAFSQEDPEHVNTRLCKRLKRSEDQTAGIVPGHPRTDEQKQRL